MTKDNQPLNILGIIGARAGSKGVPHKNIRPLVGKPLMAWIIGAAQRAKHVNRVLVSTDSEEYARIAREHGAEVPFLRPPEIAQDDSLDIDYLRHAVDWLREHEGYNPDIVLRLHPTAPLQLPQDIDACIELLLNDQDAHAAVVVAEARQHPHKALKIVKDESGKERIVTYLGGDSRGVTPVYRQQYEPAYIRANVVATRTKVIDELNSLTGDRVLYHVIPPERAIDIDSEIDFFIAEQLINKFRSEKKYDLS